MQFNVRSTLKYGSIIWDPYLVKDINSIGKIQRHAVMFIIRDYTSRDDGIIQRMLEKQHPLPRYSSAGRMQC